MVNLASRGLIVALALLHGALCAVEPARPATGAATRPAAGGKPGAQAAAASARAETEPGIKVLEIRRAPGPWTIILRDPGGSYSTLDASGERRPFANAASAGGASGAAGAAEGPSATDTGAAPDGGTVPPMFGSAAHLAATLGTHPANSAAILLFSLEEVARSRALIFAALRKLETALGYRFNGARFLIPDPPPHNSWGKPGGGGTDGDEFLIAHLTSVSELAALLDSGTVAERQLALALLGKIRRSVSERFLIQATSDPDESVRSAALKHFERRGAEAIPTLRTATATGAASPALKELLLRLEYEAAIRASQTQALADFLTRYPQSRYETEMRYRLAQDRGDTADLHRMTAAFAGQGRVQDVVDALREGWIEVSFSGGGIESVQARLRRTVAHPISIRIPAASYFVAGNSSSQNMVTTNEVTVKLIGEGWEGVGVPAACANLPKDVPDGRERFTVQRAPPQLHLPLLIDKLNAAKAIFAVRQAAVWIVTDNASYADLGKLVSRSSMTGATQRLILHDHVARAMMLAESAGIDLSARAIWRDRATVLAGLKDPQLRLWLEVRP